MDHMVQVAPNIFLNKNDSLFIQKYLRYHPNDDNMVYQYAKELMVKGKTEQAIQEYRRAAEMGNTSAVTYLANISKLSIPITTENTASIPAKKRGVPLWFPWMLITLGIFTLCMTFLILLSGMFMVKESRTIVVVEEETPDTKPIEEALFAYKTDHGSYPESLEDLRDYMVTVPNGVSYEKTAKGYTLNAKGNPAISLFFYPEAAKLVVEKGGETVAMYPVAYGETTGDLPMGEITQKVVNPNGGNGNFGTRGLVLAKNIAIHGTDDPSSIGKKITKGCLRMNNKDIENLYPYVHVGTPYKIVSGKAPQTSKYDSALPALLETAHELAQDETPNVTYHWRQ